MIESRDGRRVVITGVGVVAPCGIGAADFWVGLAKPPEKEGVWLEGEENPVLCPGAWLSLTCGDSGSA